jgi:hypothetical protein
LLLLLLLLQEWMSVGRATQRIEGDMRTRGRGDGDV